MKHALSSAMKMILAALFVFVAAPATAQTTANGPYYATPSWDQKLDCTALSTCPRFVVLSNWASAAVLDRETGLVWEKSPDATGLAWGDAQYACLNKSVDGRGAWKLPSIQELRSLVDPAVTGALPAGHPFTYKRSAYWSSTTNANRNYQAWFVRFLTIGSPESADKSNMLFVWCVRGGSGGDLQ